VPGGMAAVRRGVLPGRGAAASLLPRIAAGPAGEARRLLGGNAHHAGVAAGTAARAVGLLPVQRPHGAAPRGDAGDAPLPAPRYARLDAAPARALAADPPGRTGALAPAGRFRAQQRHLR